jgi:hypothetical protein
MDKDDVIATLNDLIETSRDGEDGFHTCAAGVTSANTRACDSTTAGCVNYATPYPKVIGRCGLLAKYRYHGGGW